MEEQTRTISLSRICFYNSHIYFVSVYREIPLWLTPTSLRFGIRNLQRKKGFLSMATREKGQIFNCHSKNWPQYHACLSVHLEQYIINKNDSKSLLYLCCSRHWRREAGRVGGEGGSAKERTVSWFQTECMRGHSLPTPTNIKWIDRNSFFRTLLFWLCWPTVWTHESTVLIHNFRNTELCLQLTGPKRFRISTRSYFWSAARRNRSNQ